MYELEDRYWWFVARRELALQFLTDELTKRNATLLDVGCGTGKGQESFGKFGTVYGVDFSQDGLEFCASRGLTKIARADAQQLPIKSDSFDAVVTLDTIEHIPDDHAAMKEIMRVLKPGGLVLINVPAYQWLWGPHDVALMHQRRYNRTRVRKLLEDSGLRVERVSYHIFLLFPLVLLSRLLGKLRRGTPEARLPNVSAFGGVILQKIQQLEAKMIRKFDLPWGSSVVAIAYKPEQKAE
jgi:SAM-dependent methyltransferase